MRAVFRATLSAERAEVQDRVTLRDGSVIDLATVTRGEVYDAVLLLGVLMYLPASQPVIGELEAYVAPGGFLAAVVRTATSALWRPAARQDWQAALAAFDEHDRTLTEGREMGYINEIGAQARADDLGALTTLAAAYGLQLENWYGVHIAVDPDGLDPRSAVGPASAGRPARRRRAPWCYRPLPAAGATRAPDRAQGEYRHCRRQLTTPFDGIPPSSGENPRERDCLAASARWGPVSAFGLA
jgi:hypothetical protein